MLPASHFQVTPFAHHVHPILILHLGWAPLSCPDIEHSAAPEQGTRAAPGIMAGLGWEGPTLPSCLPIPALPKEG